MIRTVRDATPDDGEACAAIYAPYVRDTAITFEIEPPDPTELRRRIAAASVHHAWLVLVDDGQVTGYAYGGPFKERAAYRFACEVSVYLASGLRRSGGGRALYEVLLPRLAQRGYRRAAAGMTLPNDASLGLHHALGFEPVGTFHRVGWKHGRWHDVNWAERDLGEPDAADPPVEPR